MLLHKISIIQVRERTLEYKSSNTVFKFIRILKKKLSISIKTAQFFGKKLEFRI